MVIKNLHDDIQDLIEKGYDIKTFSEFTEYLNLIDKY
jgi:hypothetical protein